MRRVRRAGRQSGEQVRNADHLGGHVVVSVKPGGPNHLGPFVRFRVFIRVLDKLDQRWKSLLCALSLLPSHLNVGILWITELPLFVHPLPFKEPFLCEFDIVHK